MGACHSNLMFFDHLQVQKWFQNHGFNNPKWSQHVHQKKKKKKHEKNPSFCRLFGRTAPPVPIGLPTSLAPRRRSDQLSGGWQVWPQRKPFFFFGPRTSPWTSKLTLKYNWKTILCDHFWEKMMKWVKVTRESFWEFLRSLTGYYI